jgi:hypothetical protein
MGEHTFSPFAAVYMQSIPVIVIDGTYYIRWNGGIRNSGWALPLWSTNASPWSIC